MLVNGEHRHPSFRRSHLTQAGRECVRTLVHFGDQDERAARLQHTPDFAGRMRCPPTRNASRLQSPDQTCCREREASQHPPDESRRGRPGFPARCNAGRGNTLLRVINPVDLPLRRHSRQFTDGAPPPQPTSSTVNRGSTEACVRPQSVSFEWLLFIRHRVMRPKNPSASCTAFPAASASCRS